MKNKNNITPNPTEEQLKIINLDEKEEKKIFVSAIAGSGKTWTLLEKFKRRKDEKSLILSFTNTIVKEIKNKTQKEKWMKKSKITQIKTWDSFFLWIFKYFWSLYGLNIISLEEISFITEKEEKKRIDFKEKLNNEREFLLKDNTTYKKYILNEINNNDILKKRLKETISTLYSTFYIDEIQDFIEEDFLLLEWLMKETNISIILFGDRLQSIYQWRGSVSKKEFNFFLKENNFKEYKLSKNFRCNEVIDKIANRFREESKKIHASNQIIKFFKKTSSLNDVKNFFYFKEIENKYSNKIVQKEILSFFEQKNFSLILNSYNEPNNNKLVNEIISDNELKIFKNHYSFLTLKKKIENEKFIINTVIEWKFNNESIDDFIFKINMNFSENKKNKIIKLLKKESYNELLKELSIPYNENYNLEEEMENYHKEKENVFVTLSSSKGLEFENVLWLIDEKFFWSWIKNKEEILNKIYVALTRTKNKIFILYLNEKSKNTPINKSFFNF